MKVSFFLEKWPITLNEHSFWSNEGDSLPNLKIFWCFQGVEISNTGLQWLKLREKISLRSSRLQVFLGKDILKIWSKFTGDHPCRSAISIKLQSNFIEMVLRHGWSPVNLLHIFRTLFHCRRLLLIHWRNESYCLLLLSILEIQFWPVKWTAATVGYAEISSISVPSHQTFSSSDANGKRLR